jgi:hypothetical protein
MPSALEQHYTALIRARHAARDLVLARIDDGHNTRMGDRLYDCAKRVGALPNPRDVEQRCSGPWQLCDRYDATLNCLWDVAIHCGAAADSN